MIGFVAVLLAGGAVDIELRPQRLVGQERRHDHRITAFAGELVSVIVGAAEEDAEFTAWRRPRHDMGIVNFVVFAVGKLVVEGINDDFQRLLIALARSFDRYAALERYPGVPAPKAEFVAAVDEHVELGDLRGQHRRIVIRQHVHQRAEVDVARAL